MMQRILILCVFLSSVSLAHAQVPVTQTPQEIEKQVREYFVDTPELIEIARCESRFRQFTDAGNIFRGGYGMNMVGVFQFYESVHEQGAENLGYDLTTLPGNLGYAQHLYNESGTTPWNSSRDCWHNTASGSDYSPSSAVMAAMTDEEMVEKITLLQQLIKLLQTLLALQQNQPA